MGWLKEDRFCKTCGVNINDTHGKREYCDKHNTGAESDRRYKENNPDKYKETNAKWRRDHPDVAAEKQREYRERNPGQAAEKQREYRDKHKDDEEFKQKELERIKKWQKDHPGKTAEYSQNYRDKNSETNLKNYTRYLHAKKRGIIPEDELYDENKDY